VQRFYTEERPHAFELITLTHHTHRREGHRLAKIGSACDVAIYQKLASQRLTLEELVDKNAPHLLYYQEACRYWVKARAGLPFFRKNGVEMAPSHGRILRFASEEGSAFAACVANSSLFYWFYSLFSDCEHINDKLIRGLNVPADWEKTNWVGFATRLSESLTRNSKRKTMFTKQGHTIEYDEMRAAFSKPIIDKIDEVLAEHYGFTDEELDFIINYDIKYRMGVEEG
jgi:hypothetical protein